jgi:2,3-bisphosphoglycerate-independent phosphoglycerate mutase
VFETQDAYKSEGLSVVELASMQGVKSAVIMEKMGARSFKGSVDVVVEIEEEDAVEYDYKVKNALITHAQETTFTVAHFRILDRFYHDYRSTEKAVEILSAHLKDIAASSKNAGIMICGDHPPHNEENIDVPLVAFSTRSVEL